MATVSETVSKEESPIPIAVIEAQIRGKQLNNPSHLEAHAIRHAVANALSVSAAKGFKVFGGLSHELYAENIARRIGKDSLFRLICCLYADCLQQEISLHLLTADDGRAMWDAEQKGSLLEYYNCFGSRTAAE